MRDAHPPDDLVEVAVIGRPWGVRGDLNVRLRDPDSDCLWAKERIWLRLPTQAPESVAVTEWSEKGARILVRFQGVDSPEAAAALVGASLLAPRSTFDAAEDGEYYIADLMGLRVVDQHETELGRIVDVFPTGSNDVWVVRDESREVLIPAVTGFVLDVDRAAGLVRVHYEEI